MNNYLIPFTMLASMFLMNILIVQAASDGTSDKSTVAKASDAANVDLNAGESIYKASCKNCHGPTAKGMASFPKLTGHSADYLISRLELYRSGENVGPNTPLMRPQAVNLSDEDISSVAHYISITFN